MYALVFRRSSKKGVLALRNDTYVLRSVKAEGPPGPRVFTLFSPVGVSWIFVGCRFLMFAVFVTCVDCCWVNPTKTFCEGVLSYVFAASSQVLHCCTRECLHVMCILRAAHSSGWGIFESS